MSEQNFMPQVGVMCEACDVSNKDRRPDWIKVIPLMITKNSVFFERVTTGSEGCISIDDVEFRFYIDKKLRAIQDILARDRYDPAVTINQLTLKILESIDGHK